MRTRAWRDVGGTGSLNPSLGLGTRVRCVRQPTERMGQIPPPKGDRDPEGRGQRSGPREGLSGTLLLTYQPSLGGRGHGSVGFQEPAVVGQKQPQSHVKREDQGSPQTGSKQCGR